MNKNNQKKSKFTKEFKIEAIKWVTEPGYSQTEAGKMLGIDPKNLSRWMQTESGSIVPNKIPTRLSQEQEELIRLRKENKRLQMERDILKKAAAFFANENN